MRLSVFFRAGNSQSGKRPIFALDQNRKLLNLKSSLLENHQTQQEIINIPKFSVPLEVLNAS